MKLLTLVTLPSHEKPESEPRWDGFTIRFLIGARGLSLAEAEVPPGQGFSLTACSSGARDGDGLVG